MDRRQRPVRPQNDETLRRCFVIAVERSLTRSVCESQRMVVFYDQRGDGQSVRVTANAPQLVLDLVKRDVQIWFVKENLIFTGKDSPMAHLLLSVIGAVAQFERDLIRERQREKIARAKQRNVYLGRVRSLSAAQADELRRRIQAGERKLFWLKSLELRKRRFKNA